MQYQCHAEGESLNCCHQLHTRMALHYSSSWLSLHRLIGRCAYLQKASKEERIRAVEAEVVGLRLQMGELITLAHQMRDDIGNLARALLPQSSAG